MAELHLIIADPALRGAVAEQLKLGALGGLGWHEGETPPHEIADGDILVIDGALCDAKTLKRFCGNKAGVFILGECESAAGLAAEIFPKPVRLGHLLARLQFHIQILKAPTDVLAFGAFTLEPAARQLTDGSGNLIRLTEKETDLLNYIGRSEKPVARDELLAAIWGYDGRIDTHTLETHIYRLRRKLDPEGSGESVLIAENGAYRLVGRAP